MLPFWELLEVPITNPNNTLAHPPLCAEAISPLAENENCDRIIRHILKVNENER